MASTIGHLQTLVCVGELLILPRGRRKLEPVAMTLIVARRYHLGLGLALRLPLFLSPQLLQYWKPDVSSRP